MNISGGSAPATAKAAQLRSDIDPNSMKNAVAQSVHPTMPTKSRCDRNTDVSRSHDRAENFWVQNFDERSGGRLGQPEDSGKQCREYTPFYCRPRPSAASIFGFN